MKRKTLLLINPANQLRPGFHVNRATVTQPLALAIVAALTPADWKIKLIDENFRSFSFYDADLVGITAFTSTVTRAYEIAGFYRAKGIPTVLGGIHASMMTDEALNHVDAVVSGEAETVWPQLIRDFENGAMKRLYTGYSTTLVNQPLPRRDLFHPGYVVDSIQTTRGCPMNCNFCSVTAFNGNHYRFRPVEEVVEELRMLPRKFTFFIDDNIIGYNNEAKERAKVLFEAIIRSGIKKHWISQSSINFADDPEILRLASRSGCRMIFMGIESELEIHLAEANKKLNLKRGVAAYREVFRKMHRHGIGVIAGLIFGWDQDTPETLIQRARFARQCGADSFQNSILTPLPGTLLFDRMKQQERMMYTHFPDDWQRYDFIQQTIVHPSMSPAEFSQGVSAAYRSIFSPGFIVKRGIKTLLATRHPMTTLMLHLNYWHYRKIYREGTNYTLIRK